MDKRFGTLAVLAVTVFICFFLIGCGEKKSEMPIGEIMANTAVAPAPAVEEAAPAVEAVTEVPAVYVAPTIEEIQTALKNAGYYSGAVDGKLGPKSKKAIEAFQNENGLKADGKVGPKTWDKLKAHLNNPAAAAEVATAPIAD